MHLLFSYDMIAVTQNYKIWKTSKNYNLKYVKYTNMFYNVQSAYIYIYMNFLGSIQGHITSLSAHHIIITILRKLLLIFLKHKLFFVQTPVLCIWNYYKLSHSVTDF